MDNLKKQLIKIGSENRGLRPHLKEILNHVTKTAKKDTDELLARNNETTEDVLDGFEKYLLYRNLKPSGGWRYDGENRGFVIYKMRGNKPTKWSAELQFDGVYVKPAIFFENEENGKMQGMGVPGGIGCM